MRLSVLLIGLVACLGGSDAGKTLVYAFDGEPQGRLDRTLCATGVGLNVPLGITDSLAYSVAGDGRSAILGTCGIEGGQVTECFTISPEVELTIADNGDLVGANDIRVQIADSDCSGATLASEWTLTLTEGGMDAVILSTWHLDQTAECEDFESDVIRQSTSGLGIEDCLLTHEITGTLAARCSVAFDGSLNCKAP